MKDLTFIIVTFLRDEYLFECIKSLRKTYGWECSILVGENNKKTKEKEDFLKENKAKYYKLPFDSGVTKGRNKLIKKVKTKYVCVGDDDFYYDKNAKVDELLNLIKEKDMDLVGGRIREGSVKNYQGFIEIGENFLKYRKIPEEEIEKVLLYNQTHKKKRAIRCDITFNFFVVKTSVCREITWDEKIKVASEHSDWFISLKKAGKKIYFYPNAIVIHKPVWVSVKNKKEYSLYRKRKGDNDYFGKKHNLCWSIGFNGRICLWGEGFKDFNQVNILIPTMMRKEALRILLFSLVRFYPYVKILIADQGKDFSVKEYKKLWEELYDKGLMVKPTAFNVPFDSGLSKTRNFLVKNSRAKFLLFLDDDFFLEKDIMLGRMLDFLKENEKFGIIGGMVKEEDGQEIHFEHNWKRKGRDLWHLPLKSKWKEHKGLSYRQTESVLNFFLARKEMFKDLKWDNDIKIQGEHTDFFLKVKDSKWKVAYTPDIYVKTSRKNNSTEYKQLRKRDTFFKRLFKKKDIDRIIYLNKNVYELKADKIIKYKTNESYK